MSLRSVLIGIGACLVLAIAFYFAIYSPLDQQEQALAMQTADLQAQQTQLRNQLNSLQAIRDSELQIRADLDRLRGLVPSGDPAQPAFVRQVQLAADASGVAIQSLTFGPPVAVEAAPVTGAPDLVLAEIPLNAVVEGGYFQAVDLFRRIEVDVTRAVAIDTVGIVEGEDGFPGLSVAVTGRIFALLPFVEVPPPPPDPNAPPVEGATEVPTPVPTEAGQ